MVHEAIKVLCAHAALTSQAGQRRLVIGPCNTRGLVGFGLRRDKWLLEDTHK